MDNIPYFIQACCKVETTATTTYHALYGAYKDFCDEHSDLCATRATFMSELAKLGYRKRLDHRHPVLVVVGLSLDVFS